ncbi:unnamed protein product [Eruca vesicaria subsp. sativa]|uniref:Auxin-responsive protein n=1 Tax=Eruca vesicaria subsp. sativa TaxID=29727 RepID=A0ABC8JCS0_ERUVS|nr:unnamed protein product [Eruca vesicaria subsp. sativa]
MSEFLAAEHDYIGLSEFPTMEATKPTSDNKTKTTDNNNNNDDDVLNFKATELRLGLPGSESPERVDQRLCSLKSSCPVSGAKRVFSDAINGSTKWVFSTDSSAVEDIKPDVPVKEKKSSASAAAPASKAQVVGWPPIRSFRKNTMASSQKQGGGGDNNNNNSETEGEAKSGPEPCLYVKVSMEGAPYLRKIDLKTYKSYVELSSALEEMFSCFTIGQFGSHGGCGRDGLNESRLTDLLRGSEYVVTYEDKDSDWMLVGDVPWEMFICSCKKLRIMKSSEAIGLAPRVMEKCRSRN